MQTNKYFSQFGNLTFNRQAMQQKLPHDIYKGILHTIETGCGVDRNQADNIAHAMKEWALEKGVTHYCHWFQPLSGISAEKHDCLLEIDEGRPIARFSGAQLFQGEPDASSFPNGGIRSTFEARGYTAWDPSSPAFIIEAGKSRILAIPSVFLGYHGEALDTKTPLLRSMKALSEAATEALSLFDCQVKWVRPLLGVEQEYFLVRKEFFNNRQDLQLTGRTLLGAGSPKGQLLEDHYFGRIPANITEFMQDLDETLHNLGIPAKTRHNEVAPAQFEIACLHEVANLAADHNQLLMQILSAKAREHNFEVLLHEKPYAGVNGSGKHCNWSLADSDGKNLLSPGPCPRSNYKFLFFLCAVLQAVHRYEDIIRSSIASAGNDFRLGANEAPPAIMSVFIGEELTKIVEEILQGQIGEESCKNMLDAGIPAIPAVKQDSTDRNRTSPFAFTGNKFEFRAVGSAQPVAIPITFINLAVAEAVREMSAAIKTEISAGNDFNTALLNVLQKSIRQSTPIRFEGNNYGVEWLIESARRGLSSALNTPQALNAWKKEKNIRLFADNMVMDASELEARRIICLHQYCTNILIEAHTLCRMIRQHVIPAVTKQQELFAGSLHKIQQLMPEIKKLQTNAPRSSREQIPTDCQFRQLHNFLLHYAELIADVEHLENLSTHLKNLEKEEEKAFFCAEKLLPAMEKLRQTADTMEILTGKDFWTLTDYSDLLHRL
jgi:glutamine synthetase